MIELFEKERGTITTEADPRGEDRVIDIANV